VNPGRDDAGSGLYRWLSWLPRLPADFAARCRTALDSPEDVGRHLWALAGYALDENGLDRIAALITQARAQGRSLAPLLPFRLGILSNSTTDFMVSALIGSAARHGVALECVPAGYGQVMQEALSPDSRLYREPLDAVLIAVDYRGHPLATRVGDADAAKASVEAAVGQLGTIRAAVQANCGAVCLVQNLAPPVETLFGSLDRLVPGTLQGAIDEVNRGIAQSIAGTPDMLVDVASLAATVGLAEWHSPEQWNLAKLSFSSTYLPLYAEHVARLMGAMRGKSRRCLIMDLDNTLWGGVIGDDGLDGIQLAQGDATGEAYLSVQRYALELRQRGIVLAVSSKNTDETARLPFRKHPEMLLREEHFAVFQANWNDKPTNIKAIAGELSLGLDAMVLLDDNPVERGLVRELLPQVAVPELPADPALYVRTLSAAGYFEAVTFSNEDLNRANFYQENARRISLQSEVADIESYLASLQMVVTFQPFDETGRARITQLINKSNQFNLTTRRYTETEVAAAERDPGCFTLQVRLADIFGDNGMISVVICRKSGDDVWEIDTWLMSCRVIGRRVEDMVLHEMVDHAGRAGIRKLVGTYIPTERNQLATDHYGKLGFRRVAGKADGTTVWELDPRKAELKKGPAKVMRTGFAVAETAKT
jgi:FkbH-like protein